MRAMSVDEFHEMFVARTGAPLDGAWIGACKSTRIYCRPTCGVHPPRKDNVAVFPSCAAAERAGYRPCLLCCPEEAPFPGAAGDLEEGAIALVRAIRENLAAPTCRESVLAALALDSERAEQMCRANFDADLASLIATERRLAAKHVLRAEQCPADEAERFLDEVAARCGFAGGEALADEFKSLYGLDAKKLATQRPKRPRISRAARSATES